MVRLIAPNGARVDVAEEKADRLKRQGFTDGDVDPAAGRKRSARTRKATSADVAPDQE